MRPGLCRLSDCTAVFDLSPSTTTLDLSTTGGVMKQRLIVALVALSATATVTPNSVHAWGDEGHKIVAAIAYQRLTPAVRAKVDAILLSDTDTLTLPDL